MGQSESVAELPSWARRLLDHERVAHLGLLDDAGRPRVLPVTFALCGERLVSAIDHKRKQRAGERLARSRWLRARPAAAFTVDHYDDDWAELAWVQALGDVDILDAALASDAIAALTARYEPYRTQPPAGPVLAMAPERLLWWRASE
jgi:PPOX class probable F420-dependent enzyme